MLKLDLTHVTADSRRRRMDLDVSSHESRLSSVEETSSSLFTLQQQVPWNVSMAAGLLVLSLAPGVWGWSNGRVWPLAAAPSHRQRTHSSMQSEALVPELSRRFLISRLGTRSKEEVVKVVATPEECAAVARRLDIPQVHAFIARCTVRKAMGETISVRGNLTADVTQRCVLTDEFFRLPIRADFAALFHPNEESLEEGGGLVGGKVVLAYQPDSDEVIDEEVLDEPGVLDLGEMITQYLSLNIDQFPRKPGAVFEDYFESDPSGAQQGFTMGDLFPTLPSDLVG